MKLTPTEKKRERQRERAVAFNNPIDEAVFEMYVSNSRQF